MASKPIRVFWSPLSKRFYASRAYKEDKGKGFVTITGEQFDVTDDIAGLVLKHDIVFTKGRKMLGGIALDDEDDVQT